MILSIANGVCALAGVIVGYILCEIRRKRQRQRRECDRRKWLRETKQERTKELFREIGGDV